MTRSAMVMALVWAVGAAPQLASAQAVRPKIAVQRDNDLARSVLVEAGDLKVRQQLTPDAFLLTLATGSDQLTVAGGQDGRIVVKHRGREVTLALRSPHAEKLSVLRNVLESSAALVAFDRLMATTWAAEQMPAATVAPVHALLDTLRGRSSGVATVAAMARTSETSPAIALIRQPRTPRQCWDAYSRDVIYFTYDYQSCVRAAEDTWNPLHIAGCAYEYNLKTIYAAYWYASCNGA